MVMGLGHRVLMVRKVAASRAVLSCKQILQEPRETKLLVMYKGAPAYSGVATRIIPAMVGSDTFKVVVVYPCTVF